MVYGVQLRLTRRATPGTGNNGFWRLTRSTIILLGMIFVTVVLRNEPPRDDSIVIPPSVSAVTAADPSTKTKVDEAPQTTASTTTLVEQSTKHSHAEWERLAREEQAKFCEKINQDENLPQNTMRVSLDTTRNGGTKYDMIIYHKSDVVSRRIRRSGAWDRAKTEEMIRLVKEYAAKHETALSDLTFVDIGGNVGWFTLVMASLGLNVITVEPMSFNLELLRRSLCLPENAELAKRVVLHGKGVSNAETTCTVYSQPVNVGDGTLACGGANPRAAHQQALKPRGQVQVFRVDDLIDGSMTERKIVALKMDTEGHEALVVEGGKRLFLESHIPMIFTEFNPSWIKTRTNRDPFTFMHQFVDAGYSVRVEGNTTTKSSEEVMDANTWAPSNANEVILEYAPKATVA